jgi:hypothetical protein
MTGTVPAAVLVAESALSRWLVPILSLHLTMASCAVMRNLEEDHNDDSQSLC